MTRLPRSPGSTLVLRLNQETVYDFILLFMPPCDPHLTPLATRSLERSLLVFSTPGGLTSDDLRACSSPAPTPVKPQPAPTILSQESVHTTLSITHHTRKRPSTGPRTTHGPRKGRNYSHRIRFLHKGCDLLQEIHYLSQCRFGFHLQDSVLFMSALQLFTKGDTGTSRAMPPVLNVHPSWQEEHMIAREVGHRNRGSRW
jgi:hypothetical protein